MDKPIPALQDKAGLVSVLGKVAEGQRRGPQLALLAGVQAFFRTSGCRRGCVRPGWGFLEWQRCGRRCVRAM